MKQFRTGLIASLLAITGIALALTLAACASSGGTAAPSAKEDEKPQTVVQIDEDDFKSDANGILKINNLTAFDVAIFAGRVERGNYLGAIKARGSRVFDISKLDSIPKKGAFLFRAAAYQELDKKGKAGMSESDVVYTGLVAYDLDRPDRKLEKDIYANVDNTQETFIYVANLSKYVLELRVDSPDGQKVAVLAPGQRNKKIWMKPQENGLPYRFFATYVYVNPNTGDVDAFTDEQNLNGQRFEPRTDGPNLRVVEFKDPATQPGGKVYNVAFIKLQNDTNGLLSFETAQAMYTKNERGTVNTNPGDIDTYQVASVQGAKGQTYTNMGVETDDGHFTFKPPLTLKPGYEYAVVVTQMNGTYQHDYKEIGPKAETESNRVNLYLE